MSVEDLKEIMQQNYISYASYVILERAIPNIVDGLKPVQRRILHTLWKVDDGKLHKVANIAGQTMAYHPHGDAPITDALVNLANKGYLLDCQGNFGNIFTGDPAAASRYIETRLTALARETLYNPDLTSYIPSYDGRNQEPVCLPAKIPVLLMQGSDGIAVGMSTRILPHNFVELLEAEIALLEGKTASVLPDFPTGGIMDASEYAQGRGKIKLRAKIAIKDPKTLVIEEICYGTTTESVTRSIEDAARKGKIKIDSIRDYTADKVEIEIQLPRGQYADQVIQALYGFTECQVVLHSEVLVIKDNLPFETTVDELLRDHATRLQEYLKRELEIERDRLVEKIFDKSLEEIFIEKRIYKKLEEVRVFEKLHEVIDEGLKPYVKDLHRKVTHEDREKLLSIPIRRISRFDIDKNQKEIQSLQERLGEIKRQLSQIKKVTINYLKELLKKYGKLFPRRTVIQQIEEIDRRAIAVRAMKVGFDPEKGFLGSQVKGEVSLECSNFDKILLLHRSGLYRVINIPEKLYVHREEDPVVYAGVADKKTVISVLYSDPKSQLGFAKRFVVTQFILEKEYRYLDEGMKLEWLSTQPDPEASVKLKAQAGKKAGAIKVAFKDVRIKGVTAKGIRVSTKPVASTQLSLPL